MQTTWQILDRLAKSSPHAPLFKWHDSEKWQSLSMAEGAELITKVAGSLARVGVGYGDRVAIVAENRPEWPILDMAAHCLGAVTVGLYPTDCADNWANSFRESQPKVAAVSSNLLPAFVSAIQGMDLRRVIVLGQVSFRPATGAVTGIGAGAGADTEFVDFTELMDGEPAPVYPVVAQDIATIIYTSGTTGTPLGVMLSHGNLISNAEASIKHVGIRSNEDYLSILPMCHAFERTGQNALLRSGGCIWFGRGLSKVVDDFAQCRPTVICVVPRLLEKVHERVMEKVDKSSALARNLFRSAYRLGSRCSGREMGGRSLPPAVQAARSLSRLLLFGKVRALFGNRLRFIICGGAAISPAVVEFCFIIGIPCYEGYGITECGPIVSGNKPGHTRPGTVGLPLYGVQIRLGDDDEVLVRGPNVMSGYWQNPQATAAAMDGDGWFRTGDLGKMDEQGNLSIVERKKEILVTAGGKNISPVRVEGQILKSPFVSQVCIVADGKRFVSALVVPDFNLVAQRLGKVAPGDDNKARQLFLADPRVKEFIASQIEEAGYHLARYESVREFALLSDEFLPENGLLTPTLKLRRKQIEARYAHLIDEIYEGNSLTRPVGCKLPVAVGPDLSRMASRSV